MSKAGKSKISRDPSTQAYLIGGGIASLSAAAYMIRDAGMSGQNIHIFEYLDVNGGSMDGSGEADSGYMIRGGRMFNLPAYECFQDLFKSVPSLEFDGISATEEFWEFNEEFKTMSRARLVNADGSKVDVTKMGFDRDDRMKMAKLIIESEEKLGDMTIQDFFGPHFFETNFWYMWQTTFAFQAWSSAVELKRYMIRFMHEFPRIHTLAGVARTQCNQYDSVILPMVTWLKSKGVNFHTGTQVTDIRFESYGEQMHVASEIYYTENGQQKSISIRPSDIVTFTNGSMTDNSTQSKGSDDVPAYNKENNAPSFVLWDKIAKGRPEFGKPGRFSGDPDLSMWQSFTLTMNDNPAMFDYIQRFTRNHPGGGALVTFKDSSWRLSIVVARQPHFKNQPLSTQVLWGYSLFPLNNGDYVKKPMVECTGKEIIDELLYHMQAIDLKEDLTKNMICRVCIMPYITSQFMPRSIGDRPLVNPEGYENFAFISQFAEQPDDVVFTVEYSIRAAQRAVYYLFGLDKELTSVSKHEYEPKVLLDSFLKLHS